MRPRILEGKIRIRFKTISDENSGFEVLVDHGMKFSYIGNHIIRVSSDQVKVLKANKIKFKIFKT
jgi:hypothetical protein